MSTLYTTIISTIHAIFQADLGVDITNDESDFFEELHVDSLAFLNAIARLEKTYQVRFANEEIPALSSCVKLADGILAHQPQG